ncbi:MAG: hypothetical protein C5B59_12100 [Bacteroidetes bacterium]|nr:MAG: hypothetical protein C5B59_12100 [Bacteroidota bacterium]
MRFEYVVTLKRENEKYIDVISFILCFLSVIASLFEQLRSRHFNFFFTAAAIIIAGGLVTNLFAARKGDRIRYRNWLLIAGLFWLGMPYLQWLAILFFLLAFLEYQAKYPLEIGFSRDIVVINTLFKKKFAWSDFNNVMLKDGLLTLDFRDNRLFQKEALEDEEDDADEDEFNTFCSERLKNSNKVAS